jgi:hypothetical protein
VQPGSPGTTTTPLFPYPLTAFPIPSCRFLCEAWWTCFSSESHVWRDRSDVLISTGEPYSVVPPQIRFDLDLLVHPEPRWTGAVPDWRGVPCRIGRVDLWLSVQSGFPLRRLSLLVLLPTRNVPSAPPFVHLGIQFFLEHGATVAVDCSSNSPVGSAGRIVTP